MIKPEVKPVSLLARDCSQLSGAGLKTLAKLKASEIFTIGDLLWHFPFRYEDKTKISLVAELNPNHRAVVVGTVVSSKVIFRAKKTFCCRVQDSSREFEIIFFNFSRSRLPSKLIVGTRVYLYGEVRWFGGHLTMVHPEFEILTTEQLPSLEQHLSPVYPTILGLTQKTLRKLIFQALELVKNSLEPIENLPIELLVRNNLAALDEALFFIHRPPKGFKDCLELNRNLPTIRRLIYEELLAEQLGLLKVRLVNEQRQSFKVFWSKQLHEKFLATLPFTLTSSQLKVIDEIVHDLGSGTPMLRLVQGEVGCGKTIVAAAIALQVIRNHYQVAIMAPTELLANQHFNNLSNLLLGFGVNSVLLSNKVTKKQRQLVEQQIKQGVVNLIIGTHTLFQKDTKFSKLGLVIIDEQHRFGVKQRLQLRDKGQLGDFYPHQLLMTATPIPRSLAMVKYADFDCSIIAELPSSRPLVSTLLVANSRREMVIRRVFDNCRKGKQAYWVCPLIEKSEVLEVQAAIDLSRELTAKLSGLRIELVHGKMLGYQKEEVMKKFLNHQVDLLIATTVIEVGIDVPNASLIIIENAERLGLVQLHQLRGRVGRGQTDSFCVLLYGSGLSQSAKKRLSLIRNHHQGLLLAQHDLEMRGLGEVFGTKQTGVLQFKIADLVRDEAMLEEIRASGVFLLRQYPEVALAILERWLGSKIVYGYVS
jgi:ATP-dependent DNA helicase RecG